MSLFSFFKKNKTLIDNDLMKQKEPIKASPPVKTLLQQEVHNVAGVSFRQNKIQSLGFENDDFHLSKKEIIDSFDDYEKIYKFCFCPNKVDLIEEPDNPADPNAIKVVIDGVHVGYIKKGSCAHVRKLIRSASIASIEAEIWGGKYKQLIPNDDDGYSVKLDESVFYIKLTIILK